MTSAFKARRLKMRPGDAPTFLVKSDPCVMAGVSLEGLHDAITEWVGERCPDIEPSCVVCRTWSAFDQLCETFELNPGDFKGIAAALEDI